jgi:hypothetical protein
VAGEWADDTSIVTVGAVPNYRLKQTTKFVQNPFFPRFSKLADPKKWGLARVDLTQQIFQSFDRFNAGIGLRPDEFIESCVADGLDEFSRMFSKQLSQTPSSVAEVIGYLDASKSAGFGHGGTKQTFMDAHHPLLVSYLEDLDLMDTLLPIWAVTGKDELRAKEKVVRTIQAPPVIFQACVQKYCKKATEALFSSPTLGPFKPGIAIPQEWEWIVHRLEAYSGQFGDFTTQYMMADIKTFDAGQPPAVRKFSLKLRLRHLKVTPLEKEHVEKLFRNLVYRVNLLPDGSLVLTRQGMGSGDPNTTSDNCLNHLFEWFVMWKLAKKNPHKFSLFVEQTGMCLFGDDIVAAAHSEIHLAFYTFARDNWEKTFGTPIKMFFNSDISKVDFLGRRSATDDEFGRYNCVPADPIKLASSLIFKSHPASELKKILQQAVAHRTMFSACRLDYNSEFHPYADALDEDCRELAAFADHTIGSTYAPDYVSIRFLLTCHWEILISSQVAMAIVGDEDVPWIQYLEGDKPTN